jgi:hypothetical protein
VGSSSDADTARRRATGHDRPIGRSILPITIRPIAPRRLAGLLAGFLPVALAAAWVPARSDLPNTDLALILVLCVAVTARLGGRPGAVIASLAGATAFDFFDTRPYGELSITAGRDIVTALLLLAVGLVIGELTVRLSSYRAVAARRGEDFAVMSGAAQLMGFGQEAAVVVAALGGELVSRLGLADCRFEYGPLTGERPYVNRDGLLVDSGERPREGLPAGIDLPVWAGRRLAGHYLMTLRGDTLPDHDRLVAALGIAEQAGAALAGRVPELSLAAARPRWLRPVR